MTVYYSQQELLYTCLIGFFLICFFGVLLFYPGEANVDKIYKDYNDKKSGTKGTEMKSVNKKQGQNEPNSINKKTTNTRETSL